MFVVVVDGGVGAANVKWKIVIAQIWKESNNGLTYALLVKAMKRHYKRTYAVVDGLCKVRLLLCAILMM